MQPNTYCNLCLYPLELCLCLCYSKLFQRVPSADFATFDIGTMERRPVPVVASPQYQHPLAIHAPFHFMPDLPSGTQSFYNAAAVALPLLIQEFGEGGMINPMGPHDHWQPLLLPTNPTVSGVGAAGLPQPVVASPAQVSAAHRRRTNRSPRRFACGFCPRDFTAKHNLLNHINSHLRKKDHKCGSCGKSFATRSSLLRHSKKCRENIGALAV